jgi:hypothetical protein
VSFVNLPARALVPHSEVERLRKKLAVDSFWRAIDSRKDQPLPERHPIPRYLRIEDQPDTFVTPPFVSELPIG